MLLSLIWQKKQQQPWNLRLVEEIPYQVIFVSLIRSMEGSHNTREPCGMTNDHATETEPIKLQRFIGGRSVGRRSAGNIRYSWQKYPFTKQITVSSSGRGGRECHSSTMNDSADNKYEEGSQKSGRVWERARRAQTFLSFSSHRYRKRRNGKNWQSGRTRPTPRLGQN